MKSFIAVSTALCVLMCASLASAAEPVAAQKTQATKTAQPVKANVAINNATAMAMNTKLVTRLTVAPKQESSHEMFLRDMASRSPAEREFMQKQYELMMAMDPHNAR